MATICSIVNAILVTLIAHDAHHHLCVKAVYLGCIYIVEIAFQPAHPQALLLPQGLALPALTPTAWCAIVLINAPLAIIQLCYFWETAWLHVQQIMYQIQLTATILQLLIQLIPRLMIPTQH